MMWENDSRVTKDLEGGYVNMFRGIVRAFCCTNPLRFAPFEVAMSVSCLPSVLTG